MTMPEIRKLEYRANCLLSHLEQSVQTVGYWTGLRAHPYPPDIQKSIRATGKVATDCMLADYQRITGLLQSIISKLEMEEYRTRSHGDTPKISRGANG